MIEKEIELEVKLEDIVLLSESIQRLANEVYNLHLKMLKENNNDRI